MSQQDISSGDNSPELSQASIIAAATLLNRIGLNFEIPAAVATVGPVVMRRGLTIFPGLNGTAAPAQTNGFGSQLTLTHGQLRSTLLQQSVDVNDERIYLLNNASPPNGAYTGNFVADKANAASSYYLQHSGQHEFSVAGISANAGDPVTFSRIVTINNTGLALSGGLGITKTTVGSTLLASMVGSGNGSSLSFDSVGTANAYIWGSSVGDSVIRAENSNLAIGALAGNVFIGSSTKTYARFTTDQRVLFPGINGIANTWYYGSLAVGGGITAIVGTGSDDADANHSFWIYKNAQANDRNGGGLQLNSASGLDVWVGDTTANWQRVATFCTNAKFLVGGATGTTPIGDVHINQFGGDLSGSLSLTGLSQASYVLLGNRDSLGTAGPAMIVASNRCLQFGVGDSYVLRNGGNFTEYARFSAGSFGIGINNPETYDKFVVNVQGSNPVGQRLQTTTSPATTAAGALASGLGLVWGGVVPGLRLIAGADTNNAGLALMVGNAGSTVAGLTIGSDKNVTIAGTSLSIGTTATLASNAATDTYLRGGTVNFQNNAGTVTWMSISSTVITTALDVNVPNNLAVGSVLTTYRQAEVTADKTVGSGTVVFDYNVASVWQASGATANYTANFTNLPTTANRIFSVSIIQTQGATAYYPSFVQIGGTLVTVKWAGGAAPVATPNGIDLFQFSFIRTSGGTWNVIASATPFA